MFHRLTKEILLYAVGNFLQRGTAFILIMVYTSILSVMEYGQYETINTIVQSSILLLNFGLNLALIRYCPQCKDEKEIDSMVRTSTLICLGLSGLSMLLIIPIVQPIGKVFSGDNNFPSLLILGLAWAAGSSLNLQLFSYYRALRKVEIYVKLSFAYFMLLITMNLILIYWARLGLQGILLANILVIWLMNLALELRFWIRGHSVSLSLGKKMLGFGFPLIFTSLAMLILNSGDRLLLAHFRTFSEVAIYSLGYKVGLMTQMLVVQPFELAWAPYLFNRYAEKKDGALPDFARMFTIIMLIFGITGLGLYLFSPEVIAILGNGKIAEATKVVPYVIISYLGYTIFAWSSPFVWLLNRNIILTGVTFIMAGLNTLLNWFWIPKMGWIGAAYSTLICFLGLALLTMVYVRSKFPIRFEWRRLGTIIFLVGISISLSLVIPHTMDPVSWLLRLMVLPVIPLGLLIFRFFSPNEVTAFNTLINKMRFSKIENGH